MKKTLIAVAAIATLAMVSCKKDWSCSCVTATSAGSGDPDVQTHKDLKKSQAVANCHNVEGSTTYSTGTGTATATYTTTCTLSKK
jgi:hypothetical protein